jgi:hypothetical protein
VLSCLLLSGLVLFAPAVLGLYCVVDVVVVVGGGGGGGDVVAVFLFLLVVVGYRHFLGLILGLFILPLSPPPPLLLRVVFVVVGGGRECSRCFSSTFVVVLVLVDSGLVWFGLVGSSRVWPFLLSFGVAACLGLYAFAFVTNRR